MTVVMQCGRRFPPWPTGSADGRYLGRVVASGEGEAGAADPGWVGGRGGAGREAASGEGEAGGARPRLGRRQVHTGPGSRLRASLDGHQLRPGVSPP